jgi:hypothetical protein
MARLPRLRRPFGLYDDSDGSDSKAGKRLMVGGWWLDSKNGFINPDVFKQTSKTPL